MAYMNQEKKKEIAGLLKKEFGTDAKKRGFKYSLSVDNHATIVMRIPQGSIDFIGDYVEHVVNVDQNIRESWSTEPPTYLDINHYRINDVFTGKCKDVLQRAFKCLNHNNHDNSDIMTDYFDVGHYVSIHIGEWDKPYVLQK